MMSQCMNQFQTKSLTCYNDLITPFYLHIILLFGSLLNQAMRQKRQTEKRSHLSKVITPKIDIRSDSLICSIKSKLTDQISSTYWNVKCFSEWKAVFQNMTESKVEILQLNHEFERISNLQIINLMPNITFLLLKSLHLNENKLNNLQFLARVRSPQLTRLNISNNQIVYLRVLRKCHLIKISNTIIEQNQVQQLITPIGFIENASLQYIQIEKEPSDRIQAENINFRFKIQIKPNQYGVSLQNQNRIAQEKVEKQIRKLKRLQDISWRRHS